MREDLVSTRVSDAENPISVGRYVLHRQIARGGMATIHLARVLGDVGFSRLVAAKRLRPELADDREFVAMFLDEARIASKVHHRNVVPVLDVGTSDGEVVLVQEYVHGAPLSYLLGASAETGAHLPIPVAVSIACQMLAGLHAAHETVDELGTPLHIVHRDVSPQNIMIATDGTARLLDFGIAKASARAHVTRKGTFKGKLAYAAPEQIRSNATKQSDIFSLAVVLWEMIVGARLHRGTLDDASLIQDILTRSAPTITDALDHERELSGAYRWKQLEAIAPVIAKGLAIDARRRWMTAAEMEEALTNAGPQASTGDVAAWLQAVAGDLIAERDRMIASEEASWRRCAAGTGSESSRGDDLAVPLARSANRTAARAPARVPTLWSRAQRRLDKGVWHVVAWTCMAALALTIALVVFLLASGASDPPHRAAPLVMPPVPGPATATDPASIPPLALPAAAVPLHIPAAAAPAPPPPMATKPHHVAPSPSHPAASATHEHAPATATAASPRAASVDCNPPYYFQGDKKIFKPTCI
jgi:eukaryotic-like serine/threonine-protein kinase